MVLQTCRASNLGIGLVCIEKLDLWIKCYYNNVGSHVKKKMQVIPKRKGLLFMPQSILIYKISVRMAVCYFPDCAKTVYWIDRMYLLIENCMQTTLILIM